VLPRQPDISWKLSLEKPAGLPALQGTIQSPVLFRAEQYFIRPAGVAGTGDLQGRDGLTEGDADPALPAPHDVAGQMQPVAGHGQYEPIGNSDLIGHLECRARGGEVADQAIDRAAAEPDCSGFQDAMTRCSSIFGHRIKLPATLKQSTKGSICNSNGVIIITAAGERPWQLPH
jgi:hypothetical protein